MHAEYADGSFAVHPAISEDVSWRTLVARVVLDSSGKLFVGLAGSDFTGEASTTTTIVVSFAGPVQLAGGNAAFRIALRGWGSMRQEHNDPERFADWSQRQSQRGIGQVEVIHEGEPWLHFCREVLANNKCWQEARTGQISNVDLVLLSGPTGMDPSQTSFFQLLSTGTKMVCPGASEIALDLATAALVDGALIIFSRPYFRRWAHSILCSRLMRSR